MNDEHAKENLFGCESLAAAFVKIRRIYGNARADRIIALMGNGLRLNSAIDATRNPPLRADS
jgi:hypothetical protein